MAASYSACPPHWLSVAAHQLPGPDPRLPAFVNVNREQDPLTSPACSWIEPIFTSSVPATTMPDCTAER